jgi:hypothetical protein
LSPPTAFRRPLGRPRPGALTAPSAIRAGSTGCSCHGPRSGRPPSAFHPVSHGGRSRCCNRRGFAPMPRLQGPPFGSGRVPGGAGNGAVDEVQRPVQPALPIRLPLQRGPDSALDSRPLRAVEAAGDRLLGAVAFGRAAPRTGGAESPEDPVDHCPMVIRGPADVGLFRREQRTKPLPLRVGHLTRLPAE